MIRLLEMPRVLGIAFTGLLAVSCAQVSDTWNAVAAKDQMMLVRADPPSFGFHRLATQSHTYPDLTVFVSQRGLPDFLAETDTQDSHYLILYYLKKRQAFACRTRPGNNRAVEFLGPNPITDKEFRLLDGFRRDPSKRPEGL